MQNFLDLKGDPAIEYVNPFLPVTLILVGLLGGPSKVLKIFLARKFFIFPYIFEAVIVQVWSVLDVSPLIFSFRLNSKIVLLKCTSLTNDHRKIPLKKILFYVCCQAHSVRCMHAVVCEVHGNSL